MNKKIVVIVALLLLIQSPAALALELNYPNLPNLPQVGGSTSILQYVQYGFMFLIVVAGIMGVISIAWAGFKLVMSSAAGNPDSIGDARKSIIESVLGLVLLLVSFIILQTINPQLVSPNITPNGLQSGMYYLGFRAINQNNPGDQEQYTFEQAPQGVASTMDMPEAFTHLFYNCAPGGKPAIVWVYNQENWLIDRTQNGTVPNVATITIPCTGSTPILATSIDATGALVPANANTLSLDESSGIQSFQWGYKDSGVYYYLTNNCTGISSYAQKRSGTMPEFDYPELEEGETVAQDMPLSFKIVNGTDPRERYGVMLYSDYFGCTKPVTITQSGEVCVNLSSRNNGGATITNIKGENYSGDFNPEYSYVFYINPDTTSTASRRRRVELSSEYLRATVGMNSIINGQFTYVPTGNNTLDQFLRPPAPGNPAPNGFGVKYRAQMPADECANTDTRCLNEVAPIGRFYTIFYNKSNFVVPDENRSPNYLSCKIYNTKVNLLNTDIYANNKSIYGMSIIPRNSNSGDNIGASN